MHKKKLTLNLLILSLPDVAVSVMLSVLILVFIIFVRGNISLRSKFKISPQH